MINLAANRVGCYCEYAKVSLCQTVVFFLSYFYLFCVSDKVGSSKYWEYTKADNTSNVAKV